jgi:hypothetical protein
MWSEGAVRGVAFPHENVSQGNAEMFLDSHLEIVVTYL